MEKRYWVEILRTPRADGPQLQWSRVGPKFWFRRSAEHEMRLRRAVEEKATGKFQVFRVHDRKRNMEVQ